MAVGLAVLLASLVIIMGALYTYFGHVQEQQLRDELSIAAAAMESGDGEAYLSKLHSDNYRITWLRADGTVLYDTKADAAAMENHAQREEVRQALANGTGESSRYSATLLEKDPLLRPSAAGRHGPAPVRQPRHHGCAASEYAPRHPGGHRRGPDPLRHSGRPRVRRITRPLNTLDLEHPWKTTPTRSFRPCCADLSTSGVRSTISCVLCAAGPRSLNRSPPA